MGTEHITGYDAVTVSNIPRDAVWVAGYVDGQYPTFVSLKKLFPKARRVSIAVNSDHAADVLDVETGDATPGHVPAWVERMRAQHRNPTIYVERSRMGQVEAACASAGVDPPYYWIADWTGSPHLVSGSVATQYASPSVPAPGQPPGVDVSLVSVLFPLPFTNPFRKVGPVRFPYTKAQLMAVIRQAIAYVALAEMVSNRVHAPNSVRVALGGVAAVLLGVEHFVSPSGK